jgi:hypothetical protein
MKAYTFAMLFLVAIQSALAVLIWPDGPMYVLGALFCFFLWLTTVLGGRE